MNSVGNRIKQIRKKRKFTQGQLAGDFMTKGMLSLIENDKAQPSMESLRYIAKTLGVEVNELLEQISISDLREAITVLEDHCENERYQDAVGYAREVVDQDLPIVYEAARVVELYGRTLSRLKGEEWEKRLNEADSMYLQLHQFNESVKLTSFKIDELLKRRRYQEALEDLQGKRLKVNEAGAHIDLIHELDLNYHEVSLFFAIGEYRKGKAYLQDAITYSKDSGVLYRINDLYRISSFYAMMHGEEEDFQFYVDKLSLLGEFLDSENIRLNILILKVHNQNEYKRNYDKAIEYIEEFYRIIGSEGKTYYVMEKGKALFGKKLYKEALDHFQQFKRIPEWVHPFDLSIMYVVYAYSAQCYLQLGRLEEAKKNAQYAWEHIKDLPDTPYKTFVKDTLNYVRRELS